MHNFNFDDYLQWTEGFRSGFLEAWPNLVERHDGLVAESQTHHLLVLAAVSIKRVRMGGVTFG